METNPVEAVRNNALATRVMTRVAGDAGTRTFVLVSTDKAVAPATVMGASKALAEWAVEAADARYPETASPACASATSSAPPARSCRSSAARSPRAAR